MTGFRDPVRLLDEPSTSAELRGLLEVARADTIDRTAVARIEGGVRARMLRAPGMPRRWGIGVSTAALIGWFALHSAASDPSTDALDGAAAPATSIATEPSPALPPTRLVAPAERVPSPSTRTDAPAPARATAPTPPQPRRRSPRSAAAPRASGRASMVATVNPAPETAREEARLLLAARRALALNPAAALARTDEHGRRFPDGALREERELVAVRALVALDRLGEARARADRFIAQVPTSIHRPAMIRARDPK